VPPSLWLPGLCAWSLRWPAMGPTLNARFGVSKWLPGPFDCALPPGFGCALVRRRGGRQRTAPEHWKTTCIYLTFSKMTSDEEEGDACSPPPPAWSWGVPGVKM
jgi:hypothetical protein